MVLAKVMSAKADLPSTIAAALAFAQAAAAALGVLAVWRTPEGVLDIAGAEQLGVGIVTTLVAVALALGCAYVLTGRSARVLLVASIASLLISAYWIFLRQPATGVPDLAVAYAVLPVLILGLLAASGANAARTAKRPRPVSPAADPLADPNPDPGADPDLTPDSDVTPDPEPDPESDPSETSDPYDEDADLPYQPVAETARTRSRRDMLVE